MERDFYEQATLPYVPEEAIKRKIPSTIGPYKIESLLNQGGMSVLYLGLSPKNEPLVIKVLSPKYLSHPEMVNQFLREAEIIALTDHPNIVTLYGQGEWENGLYIAMEFIQGISLKQFIVQHSLALKRCLEIVLEVAYALLHLHTHGVIHRDLKPENILITEAGRVKVIDFGIAQLTVDQKKIPIPPRSVLGTPSYMSPEQKRDPLHVTYASDIYSLGVILYELIIGELSFGSIQFSLLPKKLLPIVEKALHPDTDKRYRDVVDLITDLSKYLKPESYAQDRNEEDESKEIRFSIQDAYERLHTTPPKNWSGIDIGVARSPQFLECGVLQEFFTLGNGDYLAILGQSQKSGIEDLVNLCVLQGILYKQVLQMTFPLRVDLFIAELNDFFASKKREALFALHLIYLQQAKDSFSFVSCGFSSLSHYSARQSSVRELKNANPYLGESQGYAFDVVTDTWEEGDVLIALTFDSLGEASLLSNLLEVVHLSPASYSQRILSLSKDLFSSSNQKSQAVLTLQRMVEL